MPARYPHIFSCCLLLVCTLLCQCKTFSNNKILAQQALVQAGRNQPELEKVAHHYQHSDPDPEKLEAVWFLLANMPGKYTLSTEDVERYRDVIQYIGNEREEYPGALYSLRIRERIDTLLSTYPFNARRDPDLSNLSAEYLIANIDSAFAQWRRVPWKERYSFEQFCEWVLPYRISHELPQDWRALALADYGAEEDRILQQDSLFKLCVWLINDKWVDYGEAITRYPLTLNFEEILHVGEGACGELTNYATLLFRSRGIPAASDWVPSWGNRSGSHAWNAIMMPADTGHGIGYHPQGWLQTTYKAPKIYRRGYSIMREEALYKHREREATPGFFSGHNMADVTAEYIPVSDIEVKGLDGKHHSLAWLACFNNFTWVPVAHAEIKRNKALFRDMGRGVMMGDNVPTPFPNVGHGIVYLPVYYDSEGVVSAANPIILYEDGTSRRLVPDPENRQSITVHRKYPKHPDFIWCDSMMLGGRFEAANRPDFSDAVTLHWIETLQSHPLESVTLNGETAYRYVRFVAPPQNAVHIAEIRFVKGKEKLYGTPIGTPGQDSAHALWTAFDGDILSYYVSNTDQDVWIGLDLESPQRITSLSYSARTDDNDICPDNIYELYYWMDGDWRSAGIKIASRYQLTWRDVPSNTLYYVRNLTKGVEQRIFTYENGTIAWW